MKKAFGLALALFLLSAIMVCAQNKNVPELWKFSFDERTWETAHVQDSGGEKLVVYVPKGQTIKDWTESVQMQELHMLGSVSVEEFLELLKSAVLKNCPNGQYEIIKNFKGNEAIAEWHSGMCQGLPVEEALLRIRIERETIYILSYNVRTKNMDPKKRKQWLSILDKAQIK